jgi:phosphomevalonate kinase
MLKQLSVPGNILLLGEYAVLEQGGIGFALATDIRVRLEIEPGEAFGLTGTRGRKQVVWQSGDGLGQPLLSAVWDRCSARLQRYGIHPGSLQGHIRVDSSAFYNVNGRKGGIGSSAAVSVAVANAVMLQAGLSTGVARREALQAALEGHCLAQRGAGSGYDVYTSNYGAVGLFFGGLQPTWKPLDLDWLPPLYLFSGLDSVSSSNSIVRYLSWKKDHPAAAARFLRDSNAAVLAFAEAGSWAKARPFFERCRKLAVQLGRSIGVPAEVTPPAVLEAFACKAVGLALPWKLSVDITLNGAPEWTMASSGDSNTAKLIPKVIEYFETRFPVLGGSGRGTVTIDSAIPVGLGFGSSAALCIAVTKAAVTLQYANNRVPSHSALWTWAHGAESLFHGTPSGIDTGLALFRGLYSFRPRPPRLPGISRLDGFPLHLVVGAVPRSVSAKRLIGEVREHMLSGARATSRSLRDLGDIANQAIGILKKGDARKTSDLGVLAVRAHNALKDLGLSSPVLDDLLERGRSAGALGGKVSGAGGGAFFLLYPDVESGRAGAELLRCEAKIAGLSTADTIRAVNWCNPVDQAA